MEMMKIIAWNGPKMRSLDFLMLFVIDGFVMVDDHEIS